MKSLDVIFTGLADMMDHIKLFIKKCLPQTLCDQS